MSALSTASINYELYSTAWSVETCPLKMTMPFIIAILLFGSLSGTSIVSVTRKAPKIFCSPPKPLFNVHCCTAARNDHICNFQVVSQNDTHITFSWDIVDGYYNSSYINSFHVYYQYRYSTHNQSLYIHYSSAPRSSVTFWYTSSVGNFNNGPYIMWVGVYKSSALDPRYTHSVIQYQCNYNHWWPLQSKFKYWHDLMCMLLSCEHKHLVALVQHWIQLSPGMEFWINQYCTIGIIVSKLCNWYWSLATEHYIHTATCTVHTWDISS